MPGLSGEARGLRYDVVAGRREKQAIIDIAHLSLKAGALIALAGPSGSGKSTLLYLLSGLLVPSAGDVAWSGTNLVGLSEPKRDRWRRENAGFVFQNFHLIDELSPLDNVLTPGWFAGFSLGRLREHASALLDRFGVPLDRKSVALLSRGEQQRVAIARALLFDPNIIFADEPTASLDSTSASTVATALCDLAGKERKTVVVASHDPAVLALADTVIQLDHGRIVTSKAAEAAA